METHFEHICFTISLLDFVWKHNRIHHLFWNEIEKHMRVLMLFVLTNRKHLRVLSIFHAFSYAVCLCSCPSVINFRREKNTRFAILQRWSHGANIWCSCHVSGPEVLPWSINWRNQNKPQFRQQKTAISANSFLSFSWTSTISCYILLSIDITLTWVRQVTPLYKSTYTML